MNAEEQKKNVREHYARIANEAGAPSCCCGAGRKAVQIMPYRQKNEHNSAVIEETDLGLSCGSPVALAEISAGQTVLDLGSGAGIDVFLAADEVGLAGRVIGLDMTREMIERAEANRKKFGYDNVEFRKGEIESMPIESDSVDRILSNCVINLVPDKRNAFSEMFRVLKPGGRFVVSDLVSDAAISAEARKDGALWASCISGTIPKSEYLETARRSGFTHITVIEERAYPLPEGFPCRVYSITARGHKPVRPVIRSMDRKDLPAVEALLRDASLPSDGIQTWHPYFMVAEVSGKVAGAIGLEVYGEQALLRSAVVTAHLRNCSIGSFLYDAILAEARKRSIKQLVLLTATAEEYFVRKGFKRTDRAAVRGPITGSVEFTSACPSTAVCMTMEI